MKDIYQACIQLHWVVHGHQMFFHGSQFSIQPAPYKGSTQIQMWRRAREDSRVLMMAHVKYWLAQFKDKRTVSHSSILDNL